jgi:hypothetical protein
MIDASLQAAIMVGLYGQLTPYQFSCGGGNCTWPSFYSFGVCSKCSNITSSTVKSCESSISCNYATPGGFNQTFVEDPDVLTTLVSNTESFTTGPANGTIMTFVMTKANGSIQDAQTTECTLSWCVKHYQNVSVVNGIINFPSTTEYPLNLLATPVVQEDVGVFEFTVVDPPPSLDTNPVWILDEDTSDIVTGYMNQLFEVSNSDPTAVVLYQSSNVSQLLASMADNMSNVVRSSMNATNIIGQVQQEEVYIHVTWAWLILPGSVVFLAAMLLIASILATKLEGKRLWKSSSLALLFAKLEGRDSDISWHDTTELDEVAETTKARLSLGPDNELNFVRAS